MRLYDWCARLPHGVATKVDQHISGRERGLERRGIQTRPMHDVCRRTGERRSGGLVGRCAREREQHVGEGRRHLDNLQYALGPLQHSGTQRDRPAVGRQVGPGRRKQFLGQSPFVDRQPHDVDRSTHAQAP